MIRHVSQVAISCELFLEMKGINGGERKYASNGMEDMLKCLYVNYRNAKA